MYQYFNRLWMLETMLDLSVAIDRIAEERRYQARKALAAFRRAQEFGKDPAVEAQVRDLRKKLAPPPKP